jgi:hypothetical protein
MSFLSGQEISQYAPIGIPENYFHKFFSRGYGSALLPL